MVDNISKGPNYNITMQVHHKLCLKLGYVMHVFCSNKGVISSLYIEMIRFCQSKYSSLADIHMYSQ